MTTQCGVSIKLASEMASVKEERMVNKIIEQYKLSIASDRLDVPWDQREGVTTEGTILIDGVTHNWCLGEFVQYTGPATADLIKELEQRPDDLKLVIKNLDELPDELELFMYGRYEIKKGPGPGYSGVEMFIDGSNEWRKRADAVQIYHAIVAALKERHHPDHCSCCH